MQEWRAIREFPGYSVSDEGLVRNDDTDRLMARCVNQFDIVHVGLSKLGVQYKRSVPILVANAFIKKPRESFTTPINLDGDRWNNRASNILWRPRWFARKYFQQFAFEPAGIRRPIVEVNTGEEFPNSWAAALKYGLLDLEILDAAVNRTYVWPTYQMFEIIRKNRY